MYFKNEKHRQAFEAGIKKANKKDKAAFEYYFYLLFRLNDSHFYYLPYKFVVIDYLMIFQPVHYGVNVLQS